MSNLKDKVRLVTGASRGIGRAVAERLGAAGATVAINYRSRPDEADETVRLVETAGGIAQAFHVTSPIWAPSASFSKTSSR